MRNILLLLLLPFFGFAQIPLQNTLNGLFTIQSSSGTDPNFNVTGIFDNTASKYAASDVQIGDKIVAEYVLGVTRFTAAFDITTTSVSGSQLTLTVVNESGQAVLVFPTGTHKIVRPTTNRQMIAATGNESIELRTSTINNILTEVDQITTGGGSDNLGNHTATQNLNMGGFKVTVMSAGTNPTDGINKAQLDAHVDGDSNPNNEIQDLSLTGNTLSLTNDATTVDLSPYLDNTDAQTLSVLGKDVSITGGNTITVPFVGGSLGSTQIAYGSPASEITGNDQFIYTSTGRVGIGAANPLALLHVRSATEDAKVIIQGQPGGNSTLEFKESGTNRGEIYSDGALNGFIWNRPAGAVDIQFGGVSQAMFAANGNNGFGTINPSEVLHVGSQARIGTGGQVLSTGVYKRDLSIAASDDLGGLSLNRSAGIGAKVGLWYIIDNGLTSVRNHGGYIGFESTTTTGRGKLTFALKESTTAGLDVDPSTEQVMEMFNGGAVRFNKYGTNNFTGVAAYNLSVDASGNLIETATSATGNLYSTDGTISDPTRTVTVGANALNFDGDNIDIQMSNTIGEIRGVNGTATQRVQVFPALKQISLESVEPGNQSLATLKPTQTLFTVSGAAGTSDLDLTPGSAKLVGRTSPATTEASVEATNKAVKTTGGVIQEGKLNYTLTAANGEITATDLDNKNFIVLAATANRDWIGMDAQADGAIYTFVNTSNFTITIKFNDLGAGVGNRFTMLSNFADVALPPLTSGTIRYSTDASINGWVLVSTSK